MIKNLKTIVGGGVGDVGANGANGANGRGAGCGEGGSNQWQLRANTQQI